MITQAFYVSVSTFFDNNVVDFEILEQSRKNNALANLTGFLFRTKSHYFQILEGHAPDLKNVMNTIRNDSRHYQIQEWEMQQAEERVFSQWSMGYGKTAQEDMIAAAFLHTAPKPIGEVIHNLKSMAHQRFSVSDDPL